MTRLRHQEEGEHEADGSYVTGATLNVDGGQVS